MPGKGRAARRLRAALTSPSSNLLLGNWRARRSNNVLAVANQAAAAGLQGLDAQTRSWAARNMIYNSMHDYRRRARDSIRMRSMWPGAGIPGSASWNPSQIANYAMGPVAARLRERLRLKRLMRSHRGLLHRKLTGRFPRY